MQLTKTITIQGFKKGSYLGNVKIGSGVVLCEVYFLLGEGSWKTKQGSFEEQFTGFQMHQVWLSNSTTWKSYSKIKIKQKWEKLEVTYFAVPSSNLFHILYVCPVHFMDVAFVACQV